MIPGSHNVSGTTAGEPPGDRSAAESFLLVGIRRSERRLRRFDSCLRNFLAGDRSTSGRRVAGVSRPWMAIAGRGRVNLVRQVRLPAPCPCTSADHATCHNYGSSPCRHAGFESQCNAI